MKLPRLLIEEIFEYLPEEEIIYLRKVSKVWNMILSKKLECPLFEDEEYLENVGKYVKRVIKPTCSSEFLKKIVKYCPNLEYIFILNNQLGYELLKLLNARRTVKTKLKTVRVMTDKTNLYSFGLNQDVKDLLLSIQDLADLAPFYLPTSQPKYSPRQFWRSFPKLEKLVLFGGLIDFPSQDDGIFQRLTKLELCLETNDDDNFQLPSIASLRDVSISFLCNIDFTGELFSARLIMPSPIKIPNLKRLHLSMETISAEVAIKDHTGKIKAINPSDYKSHFSSVKTLELIGFILRPSEFQQLFPNCRRFEADFSSYDQAKVYTNPTTSIMKLACLSKTASTLAFVNSFVTSVSVSENLVLWALYFLPNLKHLEIIGQDQHYLNHDMFRVGKKPERFERKLVLLEWLYIPGITDLETIKSVLTVAPNLKAIFSNDHRPHGYFVRSTRPRVKLCTNLRFSGVSGLSYFDSQDSNNEMLSLMLGK